MKTLIAILWILFISEYSVGETLNSKTSVGKSYWSEKVGVTGSFSEEKKTGERWNYSYAGSMSQSSFSDPVTGASAQDSTYTADGNLGYFFHSSLELGGGFLFSTTPQESLNTRGPLVYSSYSFDLAESKEKDFAPSLDIRGQLQNETYTQTFSTQTTSRLGRLRPQTGSNSISQFSAEIEATLNIWEYLSTRLSYTGYSYDKDINGFISYLDQNQGISTSGGGMANAISVFPSNIKEFDVMIYPSPKWELDLSLTDTLQVTDSSHIWSYAGGALWQVADKVKIGLALDYAVYPSANYQTYIVTLSYKF